MEPQITPTRSLLEASHFARTRDAQALLESSTSHRSGPPTSSRLNDDIHSACIVEVERRRSSSSSAAWTNDNSGQKLNAISGPARRVATKRRSNSDLRFPHHLQEARGQSKYRAWGVEEVESGTSKLTASLYTCCERG